MDARHAAYTGWVLGIAIENGLPAEPVLDDDGNYTNELAIKWANAQRTIVVVVPPPPEEWMSGGF